MQACFLRQYLALTGHLEEKRTTKDKVKHNTKPTYFGSRRNETYDGSDVELTLPLAANPGWASVNSCLSSLLIAVLYRCTAPLACLLICTAYLHFNVYDKVVQQYSTGRSLFGSFVGMKV